MNMKTFPVERLFAQTKRFSIDDLDNSLRRILEADLAIKYSTEPVGALQMLIVDLCTPKENARR
jgi:DNA polymerase III delta subunit